MSSSVRAKFKCIKITEDIYNKQVEMSAVHSSTGENKAFTDVTPSGNFTVMIQNSAPASDFFKPGKEYYLDIIEA